jgi:hypothetical protein
MIIYNVLISFYINLARRERERGKIDNCEEMDRGGVQSKSTIKIDNWPHFENHYKANRVVVSGDGDVRPYIYVIVDLLKNTHIIVSPG